MYILKRTLPDGNPEYWCRDSARNFWLNRADRKWLYAFQNKVVADVALERVRANYLEPGFKYEVDNLAYSLSDMKYVDVKPYDGVPE